MHLGFALRRHSRWRGCDPTCTEEPAGGAEQSGASPLVPLPCPWLVHKQPSGAGMEALLQWEPFPWIFPFRALTHQPGGAVSLSGGYSARLRVNQHQTWCHPPCCQEGPHQPSASDHKKSPAWILCIRTSSLTVGMGLVSGQGS